MEVARQNSFSKAAEKLFISQPTVSKHISQLEQELGIRLLDRSVRRDIMLTPAGELLNECLKNCKDSFTETMNLIYAREDMKPVCFYLLDDCTPSEELNQKFDALYKAGSRLATSVAYTDYSHLQEILDAGDFVICPTDVMTGLRKTAYQPVSFSLGQYFLIASSEHRGLKRNQQPSLTDFVNSPLFLHKSMPPQLIRQYCSYISEILSYHPQVLLLDNTDTIMLYLKSNTGITIGTNWFKYRALSDLVFVPLHKTVQYALYWKEEKKIHPLIRQFIRQL